MQRRWRRCSVPRRRRGRATRAPTRCSPFTPERLRRYASSAPRSIAGDVSPADTAYTIGRWQMTASNGETWMTTTANTDVFDAQERIALARLACEANNFAEALRMLKPVLQAADVPAEALALGGAGYMQLRLFARAGALFTPRLQTH